MTKSFQDFRKEITTLNEAQKPSKTYDVSDFPEDGLDDMTDMIGRIAGARQGRDWDIIERGKKLYLQTFTKKGDKAAEQFFGKNAPELVK